MLYKEINPNIKIGNKYVNKDKVIIAGPCTIESREQIIGIAKKLKDLGVDALRGGAFKPRTSPYSFQGLGEEGIKYLIEAKKETNLPIITELMTIEEVDKYSNDIDIIQVGSRNMYNYELLKRLGKLNKPILLKRGLSATYEEWLMAAEYIIKEGNENVILCERGIRGFDPNTRNILDIQSIPYIKNNSNLSIFVDPSHASGHEYMIESMSLASVAAGCDGLMIEVYDDNYECTCDKEQSISIDELREIISKIKA